MGKSRIIGLFKDRNNLLKSYISVLLPENYGSMKIDANVLLISFRDKSAFQAAMSTFKDHVILDAKKEKSAFTLELNINEKLISKLNNLDSFKDLTSTFKQEYLSNAKKFINKTVDMYLKSYPDLPNKFKMNLINIRKESGFASDPEKIIIITNELTSLKEKIKSHYRPPSPTNILSDSQSSISRRSSGSSIDESKEEQPSYDVEIKKIIEKLKDPEKRQKYIKACQVQAKAQGYKSVKFVEYVHLGKVIGRVSEYDRDRLDDLFLKTLDSGPASPKPKKY